MSKLKTNLFWILIFISVADSNVSAQSKNFYKGKYEALVEIARSLKLTNIEEELLSETLLSIPESPESQGKEYFKQKSILLEREIIRALKKRELFYENKLTDFKLELDNTKNENKTNLENERIKYNELLGEYEQCKSVKNRLNNEIENIKFSSQDHLMRIADLNEKLQENAEKKIDRLINELKIGKNNANYETGVISDPEVVEGKRGIYFTVDFKNPEIEKTLFFEIEEYWIDRFDKQYQESIRRFTREVINIIEEEEIVDYELFIRGSADIDRSPKFRRKLHERYKFNTFNILHLNKATEQYYFNENNFTVPEHYMNEHLPNLRANFMVNVLSQEPYKFNRKKLHILDGEVTKKNNKLDRNVMIILFVSRK
jgi:hypothetical protein